MTCRQAQSAVRKLPKPYPDELTEHLAECAECKRFARDMEWRNRWLDAVPKAEGTDGADREPSGSLHLTSGGGAPKREVAGAREESDDGSGLWGFLARLLNLAIRQWVSGLALAAVLVVGVVGLRYTIHSLRGRPGADVGPPIRAQDMVWVQPLSHWMAHAQNLRTLVGSIQKKGLTEPVCRLTNAFVAANSPQVLGIAVTNPDGQVLYAAPKGGELEGKALVRVTGSGASVDQELLQRTWGGAWSPPPQIYQAIVRDPRSGGRMWIYAVMKPAARSLAPSLGVARSADGLYVRVVAEDVASRDLIAWAYLKERLAAQELGPAAGEKLPWLYHRPLPAIVRLRMRQMGADFAKDVSSGASAEDPFLEARLWAKYIFPLPDSDLHLKLDASLGTKSVDYESSAFPIAKIGVPKPSGNHALVLLWMEPALKEIGARENLRFSHPGDWLAAEPVRPISQARGTGPLSG